MPQLSAIYACAQAAHPFNVPVIADGGIKFSGDIVKAIVAGADSVMLGSLMAGLEESPGEVVLLEGRRFKEYRGMGSMGALQGYGRDRYGAGQSGPGANQNGGAGKLVPEGIEGRVPFKGSLHDFVYQLGRRFTVRDGIRRSKIPGGSQDENSPGADHQCRPDRKPST